MKLTLLATVTALCALTACGDDGATTNADAMIQVADATDCNAPTQQMVDVGEVTLHVGFKGCGAPIVMLHGFPEMAAEWDAARDDLSANYRVITPDQRGYNLSDVPANVADYEMSHLAADIIGLIDATTNEKVILVAHDWGGGVAWFVAHLAPEKIKGLVIMDAPHPDVFADLLINDPAQLQASSYMNFFIGASAEATLSGNNYAAMAGLFAGALSPELEATYKDGWAASGLTGMLNWYRANLDTGPTPKSHWPTGVNITVPTLVMWGLMDTALLPSNLDGLPAYVPDLTVKTFDDADHWLVHRETAGVIAEIRTFAATL